MGLVAVVCEICVACSSLASREGCHPARANGLHRTSYRRAIVGTPVRPLGFQEWDGTAHYRKCEVMRNELELKEIG
jgi:hypothetical protein